MITSKGLCYDFRLINKGAVTQASYDQRIALFKQQYDNILSKIDGALNEFRNSFDAINSKIGSGNFYRAGITNIESIKNIDLSLYNNINTFKNTFNSLMAYPDKVKTDLINNIDASLVASQNDVQAFSAALTILENSNFSSMIGGQLTDYKAALEVAFTNYENIKNYISMNYTAEKDLLHMSQMYGYMTILVPKNYNLDTLSKLNLPATLYDKYKVSYQQAEQSIIDTAVAKKMASDKLAAEQAAAAQQAGGETGSKASFDFTSAIPFVILGLAAARFFMSIKNKKEGK